MNKLLLENKEIISEGLQFHLIEEIGVEHNIYRPGSSKYFSLFKEVRDLSEIGLYELNKSVCGRSRLIVLFHLTISVGGTKTISFD